MHLTPGFLSLRTIWERRATILGALLLAACAPASKPVPTPVSAPLPVPPPTPVTIPIPVPTLAEDSADYLIRTIVLTTQDSLGAMIRRDSLTATERVHALVTSTQAKTFSLSMRSDSGYRISTDRMPPPETVRSALSAVEVHSELQRPGLAVRFNTDTLPPCSAFQSLVSPLSASILTRYLLPDTSASVQTDTISFTACDAGVSRQYQIVLRSTRNLQRPFESQFLGDFHADSSRALPMRIAGNLAGEASITPSTSNRPLPESVRIHLMIRLVATANPSGAQRTQSYNQEVETLFQREKR